MSSIRTGIGLFSGIDIAGITDQLINAQRATARRLESRVAGFQRTQLGVQALEANVLTLASSIAQLGEASTFDGVQVANSDKSQLSITAEDNAALGSFSFQALQLASTEQRLSKGFANSDTQTIGTGTIAVSKGGELSSSTRLDTFNGGAGVQRGSIQITDRSGLSATIDLSKAFEIDDVLNEINQNLIISVTASTSGGRIVLQDTTGSTSSDLIVEEVGSVQTASDLGILTSVSADTLTGNEAHYLTGDFTLDQLNDGNGVFQREGASDIQITLEDGTELDINLDDVFNLNELISAVNDHADNGGKLTASLTSGRLVLTDSSGGGGTLTVEDINGAAAVEALGLDNAVSGSTLTGDRLLAGLGSRLLKNLRGGQGITTPGQITVTDRTGKTATLDLTSAESLDEVLTAINSAVDDSTSQSLSLTAQLNSVGTGVEIVDASGATASNLIIADVGGGSTATDLGITVDSAVISVDSGSLSLRRIGHSSTLTGYAPDGGDIETGSFLIIDSAGNQQSVSITENVLVIGDVIQRINAASSVQVTASLNETGDGFLITDNAGGAGTLEVQEISGTTAADLRILGEGTVGGGGSQEITSRDRTVVTVEATDTLDSLATKLNDEISDLTAGVITDGSAFNSFRLALTSKESGSEGSFIIDTSGLDLGLSVTTEAQDGLLQVGANVGASYLVASGNNEFSDVASGIDVTANEIGTNAASVTVSRDTDKTKLTLNDFVSSYNSFVDTTAELTKFHEDPAQRGILQGQGIVFRIQSRLSSLITKNYFGSNSDVQTLNDLGIRISTGGKLTVDQQVFDDLVAENPDAVRTFFLDANDGAAAEFDTTVESLTDSTTGVFKFEVDSVQDTIDSLIGRISRIDELLEIRRERMLREFIQMESVIGQLQSQSNALAALIPNTQS